jgi:phage major head subunit gpT-like protein
MTAGQTITNKLWENTVGVPRTALERDQYGVYDPFIARMGQLAKLHRDSLGYGLLSSMLSDTSIKAYDNIAFYGNHNTGRVTAAQFNNKSAAALGALSLQAGIAALRARRDNKGVPLAAAQARPLLVVPPSLEFVAAQLATLSFIVGTQPGSGASSATSQAAQQENVLKGTFDYIVVPWLATATEWHLTLVDPLYKPVILQIETEPEIMTPPQYFAEDWAKRDQFVVGSRALHNVAPGLPEMAYGSTGA